MNEQIDPTIKALVKTIGETETGPASPEAYKAVGKAGERGRFQYLPQTWNQYAREAGVSTPIENASIEEQNRVTYKKIEQWKNQGYSPAQIASMWNAGPGEPEAYKGTFKNGNPSTRNDDKFQYDVPNYTRKVSEAYNRLKGQAAISPQPQAPESSNPSFIDDVGDSLSTVGTRLANAVGRGFSGEINPLSAILQSAGALGGGVGDLTMNALEHIPLVGGLVKGAEGLVGKFAQGVADTETGKGLITNYKRWAENHPEAAENINSAVDVASAVPILKGLSVAKNAARGGVETLLKGAKNEVYEAVAPKLGPKATAKAIQQRGTVKKGLLRKTEIAPDPFVEKIAQTVKKEVPKFNAGKPLLDNISHVQSATTKIGEKLKSDVKRLAKGKTYRKRELMTILKNLETPDLIASDTTLKNVYKRLIKRVDTLAGKGKDAKVEDLLDLRQKFDGVVKRQYPNLYRSENLTPLRQAVGDIRDAITQFTVEKLPKGFGLENKLMDQHRLIRAIENMSGKAASGATKEIGKTFMDKHPVIKGLVKTAPRSLLEGVGAGGVIKLLD